AALGGRLGGGDEWLPQRLVLAVAHRRRGQHADAIRVLGEQAPPLAHPLATVWYESRIQAQAGAGDLAAVKRTFAEWQAAGADPIELAARYALRLSTDQLDDPWRGKLELPRAATARPDRMRGRNIVWGLHRRLIAELLAAGRPEEALAAYDAGSRVIDLVGVSREELERAVERASEPATQDDAPAEIVFTIPEALHGGRLLLSPDA